MFGSNKKLTTRFLYFKIFLSDFFIFNLFNSKLPYDPLFFKDQSTRGFICYKLSAFCPLSPSSNKKTTERLFSFDPPPELIKLKSNHQSQSSGGFYFSFWHHMKQPRKCNSFSSQKMSEFFFSELQKRKKFGT